MKIIKTLLILSIAVALQTTATASSFFRKTVTLKASGDVVTKTYDIPSSSYTKIGVSSIANVRIVEGSGDIVAKIDSNLEPYLVIEVSEGKLEIKLDGNFNFRGKCAFDVVIPSEGNLEEISASGASDVVSEVVLNGDNIKLRTSGGSDLSASTSGGNCDVTASGGSDINLDCKSQTLNVSASGGADIVVDIVSSKCVARSSGGSDITLRGEVSDIDLRASGGSDIHARDLIYKTSNISESGGADIRLK